MTAFTYKAMSGTGVDVLGELEAPSRAEAVRELTTRGLYVTEVSEKTSRLAPLLGTRPAGRSPRVRSRALAAITRQLATSLEAGLPLTNALDVISEQLDHAPSRELLKHLRTRVQEGASLSDALAEHPGVFSPMYVRLVRVGETGGVLDNMLTQLADMLERQNELRDRVKTASIYPSIVLLLGVASVIVIVTFIMPRIIEAIGADPALLPWPTRVLMALSHFTWSYWWLLGGLITGAVIAWRQVVLRGMGRPRWDDAKLRLPILGRLIRQLESARFARSLGILAQGGVPITEALAVARDTIQNSTMRRALEELARSIQSGESIARPLHRCGLFPPLLVQMVRVGESTGRLGEMLLRSAGIHEADARVTLDRLVTVLPVLMILVLASIIGFIVAGLVLAIVEFQTTGMGALGG
jgi:type II secretory pathway component PulF